MSTATLAKLPTLPKFTISRGSSRKAHRTLIYGVGGIGKSSLAASVPGVVFIDLEGGAADLDVARVEGVSTWSELRQLLQGDTFDDAKAICIDSASRAEELARQYVVDNVRTDKGVKVDNIEAFGWGKGFNHLVDQWRLMLSDLERHYRAGRDVILIAHEHIGTKPNPAGDDYKRHEPRLYHGSNASVRAVTVEWCDHVLFINYDLAVDNDGKAKGSGSRTIFTAEQATYIAKSRSLPPTPIVFPPGSTAVWDALRPAPKLDVPEL